ncbi:Tyrosine-protein phosphatase non-receptor type 18 [Platysternon megacephalum]|uniref:protein-tyrosine-phosphatase n=1 Tax=Platysternon megacephalum TaxID=55544 RepID=A0A4D9DKI4_9SAUR|nr:Tyrosine-protein phosphatase non-receptor type 18 [Platysternon megacephalum]
MFSKRISCCTHQYRKPPTSAGSARVSRASAAGFFEAPVCVSRSVGSGLGGEAARRIRCISRMGQGVEQVIAMACREVEMGKKKCERYWPLKQEPLQIGPFSIVQIKEQELNPDVIVRTLSVSFQNNQLPLYDDAVSLRRPTPLGKHSSVLRISVPSEPTPDLPPKMSDTYAVVNKLRRGGGPAASSSRESRLGGGSPEWSPIDPSGFGGLQASYSLPGSPVKRLAPSPSCERPPNSTSAGDASPRGPPSPCPSAGRGKSLLHTVKPPGFLASPQKKASSSPRLESTDSYEAVDASPGNGLGYNFRIRKPKGPRDPPAEWTRL